MTEVDLLRLIAPMLLGILSVGSKCVVLKVWQVGLK